LDEIGTGAFFALTAINPAAVCGVIFSDGHQRFRVGGATGAAHRLSADEGQRLQRFAT